jgi:hypothetical protein
MAARQRARAGSPLYLHTAPELFGKSRRVVWKNIWVFAPLNLLPFIYTFHAWVWTPALGSHNGEHHWTRYSWLGSGFSSSLPQYAWYSIVGFSLMWLLFVLTIGTLIQIMTQEAQLQAAEDRPLYFGRLFSAAKDIFIRMFGLYIVMAVIIGVGLAFFIIPGLYFLRRYFLAPYVMMNTQCSIREALERSTELSNKDPRSIWSIIGVMVLIGLFNIFPFVGWMISFVLGMLFSAAPALRYRELKRLVTAAA